MRAVRAVRTGVDNADAVPGFPNTAMLNTPISACIITLNEERSIAACLDSLGLCDEIIVVDAHSTDRTREIAAARGARVIERDWTGYRSQKQFAVREARNDWIISIDADERLSP